MANFRQIIAEAKTKESWSMSQKYNYGPIDYLQNAVLYNGGWSERNMRLYQKLIRFVTDAETYFVYLCIGFDIFVDCGQLYYEMQQSFPEISRVTVWKWIREHKESYQVLC